MAYEKWPLVAPDWLIPWCIWRFNGKVGPRPASPALIPFWAWCVLQWIAWRRVQKVTVRPVCAPALIPAWAFQTLLAVNKVVPPPIASPPAPEPPPPIEPPSSTPPPPVQPRTFFTTNSGAMMVAPGGQTETGTDMRSAGMKWASLNCADEWQWADWAKTVSNLRLAGIVAVVEGRCRDSLGLQHLLDIAVAENVSVLLNIEDEFKNGSLPPALVESMVGTARAAHPGWTGQVALSTVGWVYNAVDYGPVADWPVLLQVYVEDMDIDPASLPVVVDSCIVHANAKGFTDIAVSFQSYRALPSWYAFWHGKPRSYFTGDIIGATSSWPEWAV